MARPVTEEYSELMHYTTGAGLAGIVSTGCVWATHTSFLNDAEEMTHFFDVRPYDIALEEARKYMEELAKVPENLKQIERDGGIEKNASNRAEKLASRLRSTTLAFNQAHIFSMSTAGDSRTQTNGLLSQWRGYGVDGGYAIVFDTKEFERLLTLENNTYLYQHVQWGDVHYYGLESAIDQPSTKDVAESEKVVRVGIANIIRGGKPSETDGFYQAVTGLSCLYKHWGFWEEHEVRVILIPFDPEVAIAAAAKGEKKPQKPIKTFLRGGLPVPYLELFKRPPSNQEKTLLPIKRVIVGPHRDADIRARAVDRLLVANGYKAEVICSQIPYIGR